MPQIWLTYEELGAHFACSSVQAREGVIASGWSRRRCSDGATRVKLQPATATEYLARRVDDATRATLSALLARVGELEDALARSSPQRAPLLDYHQSVRREAA